MASLPPSLTVQMWWPGFRTSTWSSTMMSPALTSFGPAGLDAQRLRLGGVHAEQDFLEVQDDVGDVLGHVGDGGELVIDALDLDRGDGRALQRREQHPPQRVAERDAEAALERLGDELAVLVGERVLLDLQSRGA